MVGLILKRGPIIVVATGKTLDEAQEVAYSLLLAEGVDLPEGEELDMLVFDPLEQGGILLNTEEPPSMEGWTADGFTG